MQIFPAIDIQNKAVVRLTQGDYNKMTVYSDNPCSVAEAFAKVGAKNLHVVDLDGAASGEECNFQTISEIVKSTDMFVEVGGGIRTEARIEQYINAGAGRVILGTIAVENFNFVAEMVEKYGDKIAVGVDERDGFVAVNGWRRTTDIPAIPFCKSLKAIGVSTVIFTDISKDGLLCGTNMEVYRELASVRGLQIVASGGITYLDEIRALNTLGTYGAILGKALYEGKLNLKEALVASQNTSKNA